MEFHVNILIELEFTQQKSTIDINQMCTQFPHKHQDQYDTHTDVMHDQRQNVMMDKRFSLHLLEPPGARHAL